MTDGQGGAASDDEFEREILWAAEVAYERVMAGVPTQIESMPPDLAPADVIRWAGDRVTELLAGLAELPLDRWLGLDQASGEDHDHDHGQPGGGSGADRPVGQPLTVRARAGEAAEVRIWVHPVGEVAASLRFALSDLLAVSGGPLSGKGARFEPSELRLPAPEGTSILLSLDIPRETPTGSYTGVVVGRGVEGAVVPITVQVATW